MNIFQQIKRLLKEKHRPLIFEIGAHQCEDTYQILNLGLNDPRIYCFEPDPRNISKIKQLPIYQEKRVTIIESAISDTDGYAKLWQSSGNVDIGRPDWQGSSSIREPTGHLEHFPWCKFDQSIEVKTITLDDFCTKRCIHHIDFLWADVQGATDLLINGGTNVLKNTKYFYFEYYNTEMYKGEKTLGGLLSYLNDRTGPIWDIVQIYSNDILLSNKNTA